MEVDDFQITCRKSSCHINNLPDEIIEFIISLLPPYKDLKGCMLVCKRWYKNVQNVVRFRKHNFNRAITNFNVRWENLNPTGKTHTISKRYSHSACVYDNTMYVFGGCTCTSTTFNDFWKLDLSTRKWVRLLTMGTYPTPKACATLVYYEGTLVLFGGWTHPSPYPLHQAWRTFSEMHVYDIESNRWFNVSSFSATVPPAMAGHSATVHRNIMVIFGGLQGDRGSSSDVWCYDLILQTWWKQDTTAEKPSPRYGQSQIALDDDHLLIMGGCGGGPNMVLNDVWLLTVTGPVWTWQQIKVCNPQWSASHLWCHPACKIGSNVVVFSRNPASSVPVFAYSKWRTQQPLVTGRLQASLLPNGRFSGSWSEPPSVDRDVNVNGRRGSFIPRTSNATSSQSEDSSESLISNKTLPCDTTQGKFIPEDCVASTSQAKLLVGINDGPGCSFSKTNGTRNLPHMQRPRHSISEIPRNSADNSLAAFRFSVSGSMKNQRERQLEALRRMEEKLFQNMQSKRDEISAQPPPSSPPSATRSSTIKLVPPRMAMFVMDISNVLTENTVSWLPLKAVPDGSPEDTILYSLVAGNGELIMFGGIQKDATSITQQAQSSVNISNTVSNSLHFITAPKGKI